MSRVVLKPVLFAWFTCSLAGLLVDSETGVQVREWLGGNNFASRTVHDVHPAIAIGMRKNLAQPAPDIEVKQDVFVDPVVIMFVMRVELVSPDRLACFRSSCE